MLVVDASSLYDFVIGGRASRAVDIRLSRDAEQAAPHVLDVEVLSIIRRDLARGLIDKSTANGAVARLKAWPGRRYGHGPLLYRAWQLQGHVRTWDAMYVALAEALGATLLTRDARLARVAGLGCTVEFVPWVNG